MLSILISHDRRRKQLLVRITKKLRELVGENTTLDISLLKDVSLVVSRNAESFLVRQIGFDLQGDVRIVGEKDSSMYVVLAEELPLESVKEICRFLNEFKRAVRKRTYLTDRYVCKNGVVISDIAESFLFPVNALL